MILEDLEIYRYQPRILSGRYSLIGIPMQFELHSNGTITMS